MSYLSQISNCSNCPFHHFQGVDFCWLDDDNNLLSNEIKESKEVPPVNCPIHRYESVTLVLLPM